MKNKYKKYTNDYMKYLSNNHRRYSLFRGNTEFKLKDFLHCGYYWIKMGKRRIVIWEII